MYLPLFVGVLCWPLFRCTLLYVLSSFASILTRNRELVALLLLSFGRFVTVYFLFNGAVRWYAFCDRGIF